MMKITVDGKQAEVHFGCRSYLYLTQLLRLLALDQAKDLAVTVNGKLVEKENYGAAEVKGADKVRITLPAELQTE